MNKQIEQRIEDVLRFAESGVPEPGDGLRSRIVGAAVAAQRRRTVRVRTMIGTAIVGALIAAGLAFGAARVLGDGSGARDGIASGLPSRMERGVSPYDTSQERAGDSDRDAYVPQSSDATDWDWVEAFRRLRRTHLSALQGRL